MNPEGGIFSCEAINAFWKLINIVLEKKIHKDKSNIFPIITCMLAQATELSAKTSNIISGQFS